VRFVREAGWGNAMRYMLTGDHWTAEESYRMGITQQIVATPAAALEAGHRDRAQDRRVRAAGVKATLASAHQMIDPVESRRAIESSARNTARSIRTEDLSEGRALKPKAAAAVQGKVMTICRFDKKT